MPSEARPPLPIHKTYQPRLSNLGPALRELNNIHVPWDENKCDFVLWLGVAKTSSNNGGSLGTMRVFSYHSEKSHGPLRVRMRVAHVQISM